MKKAVNLAITYLLFLIFGLILGTLLYSCYLNLQDFVAGKDIRFFSLDELIPSAFYVAYCLVFLICPLVSYYRIRHPGGFPQTIAYVLICLVTWLLLFPSVYQLNKIYNKRFSSKTAAARLSKGYFRQVDDKVYYFTNDFHYESGVGVAASTVVIDTSENGKVTYEITKDSDNLDLHKEAEPYKEIIVKNTFDTSRVKRIVDFQLLIQKGKKSFDSGFISYLGFISVGLLICMLYSLTSFFDWKLLNTCSLFFGTVLVLAANTIFYRPELQSFVNKISNKGFFEFLDEYINDPVLCVVNVFFTLLIGLIVIIIFAVRKHGKKVNGD